MTVLLFRDEEMSCFIQAVLSLATDSRFSLILASLHTFYCLNITRGEIRFCIHVLINSVSTVLLDCGFIFKPNRVYTIGKKYCKAYFQLRTLAWITFYFKKFKFNQIKCTVVFKIAVVVFSNNKYLDIFILWVGNTKQ